MGCDVFGNVFVLLSTCFFGVRGLLLSGLSLGMSFKTFRVPVFGGSVRITTEVCFRQRGLSFCASSGVSFRNVTGAWNVSFSGLPLGCLWGCFCELSWWMLVVSLGMLSWASLGLWACLGMSLQVFL